MPTERNRRFIPRRAERSARRAEHTARRAECSARRAEHTARRAERSARRAERSARRGRAIVAAVLFVLVFGSALYAPKSNLAAEENILSRLENRLVDIIEQAEPSVVAVARVHMAQPTQLLSRPDPLDEFRTVRPIDDPTDPDFVPTAFGAGVVLDSRGLILTHAELVAPGDVHWVTTADRHSTMAKLIAADPRCGLAVLAIQQGAIQKSGLKAMTLGDARQVKRGQFVVALGNPSSIARDGQASASWGIVANTGRKARLGESRSRAAIQEYGGLIQTDAKLNVGTSGGPILNSRGEMIGLTTALSVGPGFERSAGYALPVDDLFRRAAQRLKQGREVEYGHLGVVFSSILPRWEGAPSGVPIAEAVRAAPAHRAGLRSGDLITHINDGPIVDADDLILKVGQYAPMTKTRIRYFRGRRSREVEVELSKSPVKWKAVVTNRPPAWRGMRVDYPTAVLDYDQSARRGLVDERGCVAIREVEQESLAWQAGLRRGMFISHIAGRRVKRPDDFRSVATAVTGPVEVRLTLQKKQRPVRTVLEGI